MIEAGPKMRKCPVPPRSPRRRKSGELFPVEIGISVPRRTLVEQGDDETPETPPAGERGEEMGRLVLLGHTHRDGGIILAIELRRRYARAGYTSRQLSLRRNDGRQRPRSSSIFWFEWPLDLGGILVDLHLLPDGVETPTVPRSRGTDGPGTGHRLVPAVEQLASRVSTLSLRRAVKRSAKDQPIRRLE